MDFAKPGPEDENPVSSTAQESELAGELDLSVANELQEDEKVSGRLVGEGIEKDPVVSGLSAVSREVDESQLITIDEAKQQISKEILSVLAEKFNGKLSEVRPIDDKDIFFGTDSNKDV